jgi:hypothetical protein
MNLSIKAFTTMRPFPRHTIEANPPGEQVLAGNGPGGKSVYVAKTVVEQSPVGCVNTGSGRGGVQSHNLST